MPRCESAGKSGTFVRPGAASHTVELYAVLLRLGRTWVESSGCLPNLPIVWHPGSMLLTDDEIIGEARDHDELVALLRKRKDALGLSDKVVEEIADMAGSFVSKILAPQPVKTLGRTSLTLLLGALGLKLIVVEDPDQVRRVRRRWTERAEHHVNIAPHTLRTARPIVLSRLARKAALARWARVPTDERQSIVARLNEARKRRARTTEAA